jgi:uncharacterized membrane protein YraQ (UPF0718 family)
MIKKYLRYILLIFLWLILFFSKEEIANYLVFHLFSLPYESELSDALWFFITVFQKISLLLVLVIFLSGMVRSFFSAEKTRKALEGKSLFAGNVLASLLGIVTPYCSCSAIPLFLGFVEAGIPVGVTFSFLIAAPMISEVAVIMLFSLFGWKVGVIYMVAGLSIAIVAGWVIGRLKLERWLQDWVLQLRIDALESGSVTLSFYDRVLVGEGAVKEIFSKIWLYLLVGIAVGAIVHGYVPEDYLASMIGESRWYSVPLSILIGAPLYSCSAGAVPIASALIDKGVPLGTALAFMMSVIAISLPELIILKKVLKLPFILTFVGIIVAGIMLVGYLMNLVF